MARMTIAMRFALTKAFMITSESLNEDMFSCLQLSLSAIDKKVTTKRTSTYLSKELYTSMVERAMAKADHIVAFFKNVGVNVLVDIIPSFIQEAER